MRGHPFVRKGPPLKRLATKQLASEIAANSVHSTHSPRHGEEGGRRGGEEKGKRGKDEVMYYFFFRGKEGR